MEVSKIKLNSNGSESKLSTMITFKDGRKKECYFLTDIENETKIQVNVADAFLVGLLIPAMQSGEDLILNSPVSERLLWGIKKYIQPELHKMNSRLQMINIIANTTQINKGCAVATGLSGGVDCFYSILKNKEVEEKNYQINTLCYYNLYRLYCDEKKAIENFAEEKRRKLEVSSALQIPLVTIDSNLWDFYEGFRYVQVHTLFAMANILCFEGYIGTYYYSAGYTLNEFEMNFEDTAHYDIERFDKTRFIAKNQVAKKYLDVCNNKILANKKKVKNCSKCDKCIRTMLTLDILGILNEFSEIFDLDDYYKNKEAYWIEYKYFSIRTKDVFIKEIMYYARKKNYKLPDFLGLKVLKYFLKLQVEKVIRR